MRTILSLLIVTFTLQAFTQSWKDNLPAEKVKSENLTLYDYQKAFDEFWQDKNVIDGYYVNDKGIKTKAPGWKQFKRKEWFYDMRVNLETGRIPDEAYKSYPFKNRSNTKSFEGSWTNLGTNSSAGGYAGIGRLNCIAFHPSDNNTFWVGAPSGGLWVTTDGGSNWEVLTDDNEVIGVSDIIIPSDFGTSNTIYIATGDRDGGSMWSIGGSSNDNNSIGVLKSTDGGDTWDATGLTFTINQVERTNRLLLHPSDDDIIYAATTDGVYKTINAGTDWTKISTNNFIDMEFKPGDPTIMYGSTENNPTRIYKSSNSGDSWTQIQSVTGTRTELAVSADDATVVYAIVANTSGGMGSGGNEGVYKSTNSGDSFTRTFNSVNMLGYYSDGSGNTSGQGSYDLCIAVDPNDANVVHIGGVNGWKSSDGGSTFECVNMWTSGGSYNFSSEPTVHADKHFYAYQNGTSTLFECNDGGVYKTTNAGTSWSDLTNGMVISQIYRIGASQQSVDKVICGLQDNGTKLYSGGTWYDVKGGDGMECLIDYTDDDVQFATYVRGDLARTTNHWSSATDVTQDWQGNPINGLDETGHWVTPYVIDPDNNQTLYIGLNNVWKTTNRGDAWTKISTMNSSDKLRSLAIAPSNNQVIYAADRYNIWKTTDGGSNWDEITTGLPGSYSMTYIAVKHDDPSTLWVTFGGYNSNRIYESTNGGDSWSDISTGLPQFPIMSVVQNKLADDTQLYVGTDVGVYVKHGTSDWVLFSSGLPNVVVTELEIYYDEATPANSRINAGTYGRGLWQSDLYDPITNTIDAKLFEIVAPTEIYCGNDEISPTIIVKNFGTETLTSFTVSYNIDGGTNTDFNWTGSIASNENATIEFPSISLTGTHTFNAEVTNPNGSTDEDLGNNTLSVDYTVKSTTDTPYDQDFELASFPPSDWELNNPDGSTTWVRNTSASGIAGSTACMYIDCANYNSAGQIDEMITPILDLSSANQAELTFKVAYRRYSASYYETLKVFISTDCGNSYETTPIYNKAGTDLATGVDLTSAFLPSSESDWRTETIDLIDYIGQNISLKFQSINGWGNNLYVDEITIAVEEGPLGGDAEASISSVCSGENATLVLSEYLGSIQWQKSVDNITFTDVTTGTGYTTNNFTTEALTIGTYFRAKVSMESFADVYSDTVDITVAQQPVGGNVSENELSLCEGGTANVTLSGSTGNITWQVSNDGTSFADLTVGTGINTSDYTSAALESSAWFRARLSNANCNDVFSDTLHVDIIALPVVGTISTDYTDVCEGSDLSLTLNNYLGDIQWQNSSDNISWNDIADETNEVLTISAITSDSYYRANVSGDCGSESSSSISIVVHDQAVITSISAASDTICKGSDITLTTTGTTGTLQWQESSDNVNWTDISNEQTETLAIVNLDELTYYRYSAETDYCDPLFSDSKKIIISEISIGTIAADQTTLCYGESTNVNIPNHDGVIEWSVSNDSTSFTTWGETGETLISLTNLTETTYIKAKVSNTYCDAIYSNIIEIIVNTNPSAGIISISDKNLCIGETSTLSISDFEGNIQWQYSTNQSDWEDFTNATTQSFVTEPITEMIYVRAKVSKESCDDDYSDIDTILIIEDPIASYDFDITGAIVVFEDKSSNAISYYWDFDDGNTSTDANPSHTYSDNGTYNVMQKVIGECANDSTYQNINITGVSISDINSNKEILLYPNPNDGIFELKLESFTKEVTIQIVGIKGEIILEKQVYPNEHSNIIPIQLENISEGFYTLIVKEDKEFKTTFIVK